MCAPYHPSSYSRLRVWWSTNWIVALLFAAIAICTALLITSCYQNEKLNQSMVGQPKAALIETFGPPLKVCPSYEGSEVLEWVRHEPGYMSSSWVADGRGGGHTQFTYIPPRDVVRRAVVRNGRVASCEGGF